MFAIILPAMCFPAGWVRPPPPERWRPRRLTAKTVYIRSRPEALVPDRPDVKYYYCFLCPTRPLPETCLYMLTSDARAAETSTGSPHRNRCSCRRLISVSAVQYTILITGRRTQQRWPTTSAASAASVHIIGREKWLICYFSFFKVHSVAPRHDVLKHLWTAWRGYAMKSVRSVFHISHVTSVVTIPSRNTSYTNIT